jgi:hypothetical protein
MGLKYDTVDKHINIKIKKYKFAALHFSIFIQIALMINGGFMPMFWTDGVAIFSALAALFYCYWF